MHGSLPRRLAVAVLAAVALALAGPLAAATSPGASAAEPPDVVLVTSDCASGTFLCPAFARAAKRTGTTGRIISPDPREDLVGTLSLIAQRATTS